MPAASAAAKGTDRLEPRLVLHNWVNGLFGYDSTAQMLDDVRPAAEGFDGEGRSYVYHRLKSQGNNLKLPLADLERYDNNVRHHLRRINRNRAEPVVLKYFQHLAALYTEVLLDYRFNAHDAALRELNAYTESLPEETIRFGEGDLDRLAFWMATGSGKTLLMHLNYLQFLHYNDRASAGPLDNILLITPNERLTGQHLEELRLSSIPCERFSGASSGLGLAGEDVVRATEITKLIEEKKGGGFSVDVEAFEGRNLVFVDEGHKGAASGADTKEGTWLRRRRAIAEGGFTFEYSATFGQALAKGTKKDRKELIEDYGRSILFDYSYRYFYGDGYGKDFRLLNLKDPGGKEYADLLLLGNLLSFYQQKLCYVDLGDRVEEYNLEPPLWILVGSKVDAVYSEKGEQRSDVYDVVSFLHRFLKNESGWAVGQIERLMDGDSGLQDEDGHDVFEGNLTYLKRSGKTYEDIFRDVLRRVFRARAAGGLVLGDIKGADGELGLKVAGSEEGYFGLIYVGGTPKFKKLVGERAPDILVEDDAIEGALFAGIDRSNSPVNILVGARKFVEGWSSWRVSNMGLLNVGGSEGPMIIQLFGRGVRLKGRGFSLKRSSALDGGLPRAVLPLETLDVFGLRANYMVTFRKTLEVEGVDPNGYETLPPLELQENEELLQEGLMIPRPPEDEFAWSQDIVLDVQPEIEVRLDLSIRLEAGRMGREEFESQTLSSGREPRDIKPEYLSMLDWRSIHLDLLEFKSLKGLWNLIIPPEAPREIMQQPRTYHLVADPDTVEPRDFGGLSKLQEIVQALLRKYVEKFYHQCQQRWESERMTLEPLTGEHANFTDYKMMVRRSSRDLIEELTNLIEEADEVYRKELKKLPNVYFDRHLYQPLLVESKEGEIKSTPEGLKKSEVNFVEALRKYCEANPQEHRRIFLLRNLSRGKGIGFFKTAGFYPDFILWVKDGDRQRVVFVEPHGMRNDDPPEHNEKVRLYKDLRILSPEISKRSGLENVSLDSYMISATPIEVLKTRWSSDGGEWTAERFASEHVLFEETLDQHMRLLVEGDVRPLAGRCDA